MIIINGDGGCRLWQPVQSDSQPKSSGLVLDRRPLGAVLHLSNEPGELSQWLCHDDSTINIVLGIIIIIIRIISLCQELFDFELPSVQLERHCKKIREYILCTVFYLVKFVVLLSLLPYQLM